MPENEYKMFRCPVKGQNISIVANQDELMNNVISLVISLWDKNVNPLCHDTDTIINNLNLATLEISIENNEKCFLITKRKKISQSQSSNSSFSNHYGCMSFYSDKGKLMFNLYRDFFDEIAYKEDDSPEDDCDSGNTVIENGIKQAWNHS